MAALADSRAQRLAAPVGLALGGLAAAVALHLRDPHVSGSWGFCPLNVLSDLDCPGCGGLRAVHHLTDLDLGAAASSNLLLVLSLPLVALLWGRWVTRAWTGAPARTLEVSRPVTILLVGTVVGFAVLRNLPVGAWLAA